MRRINSYVETEPPQPMIDTTDIDPSYRTLIGVADRYQEVSAGRDKDSDVLAVSNVDVPQQVPPANQPGQVDEGTTPQTQPQPGEPVVQPDHNGDEDKEAEVDQEPEPPKSRKTKAKS